MSAPDRNPVTATSQAAVALAAPVQPKPAGAAFSCLSRMPALSRSLGAGASPGLLGRIRSGEDHSPVLAPKAPDGAFAEANGARSGLRSATVFTDSFNGEGDLVDVPDMRRRAVSRFGGVPRGGAPP